MNKDKLILDLLRQMQWGLCAHLRSGALRKSIEDMSSVIREGDDDTIFAIDLDTEDYISGFFEKSVSPVATVKLISEGFPADGVVFGRGKAEYTIIIDPIDGTRGLMCGKRPAWTLAAAARGSDDPRLSDVVLAAQTEIAPLKQSVSDQLFAMKGGGAKGLRRNMDNGYEFEFTPSPSTAKTLKYGFASFVRFFPGTKELVTQIESEFVAGLASSGRDAFYFEDQYICSGGQLAGLAAGSDRFVCELRGALAPVIKKSGGSPPLCAHPYDVCAELITREAGAIVTDAFGNPLSAPLDTTTNVSWIGYANEFLKNLLEPVLLDIIHKHCNS